MDKEVWKNVVGYEGCFAVSNIGRVKRLARVKLVSSENQYGKYTSKHHYKEKFMSVNTDVNGYPCVKLYKDGERKHCLIHRLVAEAFIPNPKNKRTVNHKDFNKTNNYVSNLEWATYKENKEHAKEAGRISRGENQHLAKLKRWQVKEIYQDRDMFNNAEQARMYGVSRITISQIVRGLTWTHITSQLK